MQARDDITLPKVGPTLKQCKSFTKTEDRTDEGALVWLARGLFGGNKLQMPHCNGRVEMQKELLSTSAEKEDLLPYFYKYNLFYYY